MKIQLDSNSIYHSLCNPILPPNLSLTSEGRVIIAGDNEFSGPAGNLYAGFFGSLGGGANLQDPFLKATVQLRRTGMEYSGGLALVTGFPSVADSKLWPKVVNELRRKYLTQFIDSNKGAYIIDPKTRNPHIAIDATGSAITVYTGTEGCPVRQLDDLDSFQVDMQAIQGVANSILDIVIPEYRRRDVTLFLSA